MSTKIDHFAFCVDDLKKYTKIFLDMGGKLSYIGDAKKYGASCVFINFDNVDIELIQSNEPRNHLTTFLDRFGVGPHHIAIKGKGKYRGAKPNMFVNFNKPNEKNRLLIEKVEYRGNYYDNIKRTIYRIRRRFFM